MPSEQMRGPMMNIGLLSRHQKKIFNVAVSDNPRAAGANVSGRQS